MAKAKGFQPSPVGLSVSRDVAHKALTLGVLHILRRPQFPQALRYMRGAMAPTYWYKCTKERRHCQVVWAWAAWGADFPYPSPKQGLASIPVAGSQGSYARFDNQICFIYEEERTLCHVKIRYLQMLAMDKRVHEDQRTMPLTHPTASRKQMTCSLKVTCLLPGGFLPPSQRH